MIVYIDDNLMNFHSFCSFADFYRVFLLLQPKDKSPSAKQILKYDVGFLFGDFFFKWDFSFNLIYLHTKYLLFNSLYTCLQMKQKLREIVLYFLR